MKRESKAPHYCNMAALYTVLAIAGGVFYREFCKFSGFGGYTKLTLVHTHYFALGTFFFLILVALEKSLHLSTRRGMHRFERCYHAGLNLTVGMLLLRGVQPVVGIELAVAADRAVSCLAGLGHLLLCAALVLFFRGLKTALRG